ncbi:MAG: mRNA interferase MazF [Acidobacteriota bacterium]|jgi:mRNA interferase MazF|nr:mRNA interferase MazF [Acidobacteriota bacterium]
MVTPSTAAVVLVPFPFSDLTQSKLRPAVVLARAGLNDFVLCQMTSNPYTDRLAIEIQNADFTRGSLRRTSYARPGKLFTANTSLIVAQVGTLGTQQFQSILDAVVNLLRGVTTP